MDFKNKVILVTLGLLMIINSAFAMEFIEAKYLGNHSVKMGVNGPIVRANGYTQYIKNVGYHYGGDFKTGIIIGRTDNPKYKDLTTNAGEIQEIYKVITSNESFTPYVIGGNAHGGIDLALVANNAGELVKYVGINDVLRFVEKNYGERIAASYTLVDVKVNGNKIYAVLGKRNKPSNNVYVVFTWDDNTGWFSMGVQ